MLTFLIVLACVAGHVVGAALTYYLWVRVWGADKDIVALELGACVFLYPAVLACMAVSYGGRLALRHEQEQEDAVKMTITALRTQVETLKAQLHEATKKPLSQGAYR